MMSRVEAVIMMDAWYTTDWKLKWRGYWGE